MIAANKASVGLSHHKTLEKLFVELANGKFKGQHINQDYQVAVQRYFEIYYNHAKEINYDIIEINPGPIWTSDENGLFTSVGLDYKNLYSYILADGVAVAYNEWLYEEEFILEMPDGVVHTYTLKDGRHSKSTKANFDFNQSI